MSRLGLLRGSRPPFVLPRACRYLHQSSPKADANSTRPTRNTESNLKPPSAALPSKWLSDQKKRIGRCIMFGLKGDQADWAGSLSMQIGRDWRELVAGTEGFLTAKERRGLFRHAVVWGEMVPFLFNRRHGYEPVNAANTFELTGSQGHVNNVTYIRYAESARIHWAQNIAVYIDPAHKREWSELWTSQGDGLILRSMRTDYKFPMTWPDKVTVYHKLRSSPSSDTDSVVLDVMILSEVHQRVAARCVEDIVFYDYRKGQKTPIRPFMREVLSDTFDQQEQAKRRWNEKVKDIEQQVSELERASWNRSDAQEDFGSAKS
ncbi:MAG: hypothetical protein M1817_002758 [Caeruleum heppii]|nr:MAG: hypothetical protein M1817_002758 [Caeruleum heppii]